MNDARLEKIERLIEIKKINEAQLELSKLGEEFNKNSEYLYLRSKIFYINKLYYTALDTLLIALEFEKKDKIYNLVAAIYDILGNKELSKKISDPNLRLQTISSLKDKLSGIRLPSSYLPWEYENNNNYLVIIRIEIDRWEPRVSGRPVLELFFWRYI